MASRAGEKRERVERWLAEHAPERIGEAEWDALRAAVPVSEGYLRRLLRESGVPLSPLVEGVRQEDFDALERSLLVLLEEYERGGRERQAAVRRLVIQAKDHARWAARKPERREIREEMVLWMLTWLENPGVFREWVKLRRVAQDLQPVTR
jgi:hypothetical protein